MAKWDKDLLPDDDFNGEVEKKLKKIRRGNLSEQLFLEGMGTEDSQRALILLRMEECLRAVDDPTIQEWLHIATVEDGLPKEIAQGRLKMIAASKDDSRQHAAAAACEFLKLRFPK